MTDLVKDYGILKATNSTFESLIQGTAVYPGGTGLWRGDQPFGPLPETFPENSLMLVAHNFDNEKGYLRSLKRGAEQLTGRFWKYTRLYISSANLEDLTLEKCFFSNALMGLQPGKASGKMPTTDLFRCQCRQFLFKQIEVVRPRRIAILGGDARKEMDHIRTHVKTAFIRHPSSVGYVKAELRGGIISQEASKIAALWAD
ncbi:MAG: hypothetical protein M3Z35_11965 [Nitrospirota bacterium]|nr:hypothetical protein [Nitrospirota bacterium]